MEDVLSRPTDEEVSKWMLYGVLKHSCAVEYYIGELGIGFQGDERPHDIEGVFNKYEPLVASGMALQFRENGEELFKEDILAARELHRMQLHHKIWNGSKPDYYVSDEDFCISAVDAVNSLLENRGYSGGGHSYDKILEMANNNLPFKREWMHRVVGEMRKVKRPNMKLIRSIHDFSNIGLSSEVYEAVRERTKEAINYLRNEYGYKLD